MKLVAKHETVGNTCHSIVCHTISYLGWIISIHRVHPGPACVISNMMNASTVYIQKSLKNRILLGTWGAACLGKMFNHYILSCLRESIKRTSCDEHHQEQKM